VDAGVEARRDQVDARFRGGDVENDVGVRVGELPQLRREHRLRGDGRGDEPHPPRRPVAQPGEHVEGTPDVFEGGPEPRNELLSRFGRGHAARRARQQPHPEPVLQPADRVAHEPFVNNTH